MPVYAYKAADPDGRLVEDTLEAPDVNGAAALLHEKNFIPIRIRPAQSQPTTLSFDTARRHLRFTRAVPRRDITRFTQDLATLLSAGLPVDRALGVIIDATENKRFRAIVAEVAADVAGGLQLSEALAKHPRAFSPLYRSMARAGETGGVLENVLARMGAYLEETDDLADYVRSALIYPAFLVTLGGLSIVVLLIYIIPRFSVIFADFGQALPLATRLLLGFSDMMRHYGLFLLALAIVGLVALRRFLNTPAGSRRRDRLQMRLPVWRRVVRTVETARFARTLGTLVQSGVPILRALDLVRDVSVNSVLREALETVQARVKKGDPLARPLADSGVFPDMAVQMIAVGEETGRLDAMLLKVADSYEKAVRGLTKRLISLLEPSLILLMGLMVGFVVISMLMAVFSINELPF